MKLKNIIDTGTLATGLLIGLSIIATGIAPGAADSKPSPKDDPLYKTGLAVVNHYHCDLCHGSDFKGSSGVPDITPKGTLHHYTLDSFTTLLNTDIDWQGKKRSIPVYGKLKPAEIKAVYFYLNSR
jgi:hypothetical protein